MNAKVTLVGFIFGLVVGVIMRLPGAEFVVAAHAINLSVMASLWLGAALAPDQDFRAGVQETIVAIITYVLVALVFQHSPLWLYIGYLLQTVWSALHINNRHGVLTREWFPTFAMTVNVGFVISLYLLRQLT